MTDSNASASISADSLCLSSEAGPFHRILIATDGSHTGARALAMGVQLAKLFHARLAVAYVVNSMEGFAPQFAWGPRTYEAVHYDHGGKLLDMLTEKLPKEIAIEKILRVGSPADELVKVMETWKPDLVIVGGPSHHRLGRLLLGSVDEAILDHAKCCVLVIGPEEQTPAAPRKIAVKGEESP